MKLETSKLELANGSQDKEVFSPITVLPVSTPPCEAKRELPGQKQLLAVIHSQRKQDIRHTFLGQSNESPSFNIFLDLEEQGESDDDIMLHDCNMSNQPVVRHCGKE
eukprot:836949-Amphidinium_carterae.1